MERVSNSSNFDRNESAAIELKRRYIDSAEAWGERYDLR
jgi:hypothetical protein